MLIDCLKQIENARFINGRLTLALWRWIKFVEVSLANLLDER